MTTTTTTNDTRSQKRLQYNTGTSTYTRGLMYYRGSARRVGGGGVKSTRSFIRWRLINYPTRGDGDVLSKNKYKKSSWMSENDLRSREKCVRAVACMYRVRRRDPPGKMSIARTTPSRNIVINGRTRDGDVVLTTENPSKYLSQVRWTAQSKNRKSLISNDTCRERLS